MKKFIYRNNTIITGEIIEENEDYYYINMGDDTISLEKMLTVIEEEEENMVEVIMDNINKSIKQHSFVSYRKMLDFRTLLENNLIPMDQSLYKKMTQKQMEQILIEKGL